MTATGEMALRTQLEGEPLQMGLKLVRAELAHTGGVEPTRADMGAVLLAAGKFVEWFLREQTRADDLQRRLADLEQGQGLLPLRESARVLGTDEALRRQVAGAATAAVVRANFEREQKP